MYRVRCFFQPASFAKPEIIQMKLIPKIGHFVLLKDEELEVVKVLHTPEQTDVDVSIYLKIDLRSHMAQR